MTELHIPFWARTKMENPEDGILYRAVNHDIDHVIKNTYYCEGSRRIGGDFLYEYEIEHPRQPRSIWIFSSNGGYHDDMNLNGLSIIQNVNVVDKRMRFHLRRIVGNMKNYDGFYDDHSIWFYPKNEKLTKLRVSHKKKTFKTYRSFYSTRNRYNTRSKTKKR